MNSNSKNKVAFFKWLTAFDKKSANAHESAMELEKAIHYWNCYHGTKYKYLMIIEEYSNWKKYNKS